MQIDLKTFRKDGMYLYLSDGRFMDFSKERIQQLGYVYWENPKKLPRHIRESKDFKTCTVCPFNGQDVLCSVMKPLLPFLEEMTTFSPQERVSVVYVSRGLVQYVPETTMQKALQYITNMSLFEYCEDGKKYAQYFQGIHPFMTLNEAGSRLILNVYWGLKGDRERIVQVVEEMSREIEIMSQSCIKRLKSMCQSDAFIGAYVESQVLVGSLAREVKGMIKQQLGQ